MKTPMGWECSSKPKVSGDEWMGFAQAEIDRYCKTVDDKSSGIEYLTRFIQEHQMTREEIGVILFQAAQMVGRRGEIVSA